MGDQLTEINDILTCQLCQSLFNIPVILPCGDRICQAHLENKPSITCQVCFESHQTNSGFPIDQLLLKLLDLNIQGNVFIGEHHKQANEIFEHYQQLILDFEQVLKDPHFHLYEVVSSFRNEIDLGREEEIFSSERCEQLLEEVDRFEVARKKGLTDMNDAYTNEIKSFRR